MSSLNNPTRYPVNDIYASVQGEGTLAGTPMFILRLQGCEVGCPWCDTKYTWELDQENQQKNLETISVMPPNWSWATPEEIIRRIHTIAQESVYSIQWVLVTGGEPTRYYLHPLLHALHLAGFKVGLETSGTEPVDITSEKFDWFTLSPKHKPVVSSVWRLADEIKQVIVTEKEIEKLTLALQTETVKPGVVISLQPVSQGSRATRLCIATALERGWKVSLQLHKYLELP